MEIERDIETVMEKRVGGVYMETAFAVNAKSNLNSDGLDV